MPSLEGLKTWFDYELLLTALAISVLAAVWGLKQITGYLSSLPLSGLPLTSPRFALAVTALGLGTLLFLIWLAGRYTEQ